MTYYLDDLVPISGFIRQKFFLLTPEQHLSLSLDDKNLYKDVVSKKVELETVIVVVNRLERTGTRGQYIRWTKTPRCTLIQEKVGEYFKRHEVEIRELTEKEAKKKRISLGRAYDAYAVRIRRKLLAEYRRRIKDDSEWERKRRELTRKRFHYERERIYDMPYPWQYWDYRNPAAQTHFFHRDGRTQFVSGGADLPDSGKTIRGSAFSSPGARAVESIYRRTYSFMTAEIVSSICHPRKN